MPIADLYDLSKYTEMSDFLATAYNLIQKDMGSFW